MPRPAVWILRSLLGAIAFVAVVGGGGYVWLRGSLPKLEGTIPLAGLSAPVEVLRDADGIVTIQAANGRDAARALGYVHAQDRLWQMDFTRRSGAGRLSEVIGERAVPLDRLMRTFGLYRVAEANLAHVSPELRDILDAYAEGVNAFIAEPGGPLPLEFQVLRYRPEPWRPADSIVWGRLMAMQLSGNWTTEIFRARLAKHLTAEQIAFLWPGYPKDAPVALHDLAANVKGLPLERFANVLPWELAPKDASNSWVVAGSLTLTGAPILANDPHLALTAPGVWYLTRIVTPEHTLTGVTAPGLPVMVMGQNGDIAWGFTTTHSDTQDVFIERTVPDDPTQYQTPDGPRPFETRKETIEIRDEPPLDWTVRATRHGPVISDALAESLGEAKEDGTVLALAWPGLREDDRTTEAVYRMTKAHDWAEFHAALKDFDSPQQNIVYADRHGTIAFAAPARVPLRKKGDGREPVPGWTGDYDWAGEIPFDDLPVAVNPPSGVVVTANNKIVPDGYPYFLTSDWPDPYRAERIETLLNGDGKLRRAIGGSLRVQQDVISLAARDLLPLLLAAKPTTDRGKEALSVLRAWDGRMTRDSAAPLVFYAWVQALHEALLADELGPDFADFERPKLSLIQRILTDGQQWCDNVTTPEVEDCAKQLVASLETALNKLALDYGRPVDRLRWGDAHIARFPHPILRYVPLAETIFGYSVETDGDGYTVNRAGLSFNPRSAYPFEDVHGPGYRAVYDLANPDNSRFMIATGESGNPLSRWYGNLAERWRDGTYLKLVGDETVPVKHLRLTPP